MKPTPWGPIPDDAVDYDQYRAAQHPEIRKLMDLTDGQKKLEQIEKCFLLGLPIDTQCVLYDWYPYHAMFGRENQGLTTVPGYLNVGTIKVSTKAVDYPAYPDGPPPPLVGPEHGSFSPNVFLLTSEAFEQLNAPGGLQIGNTHYENGHTYWLHGPSTDADMPKNDAGTPVPYWLELA